MPLTRLSFSLAKTQFWQDMKVREKKGDVLPPHSQHTLALA